MRLHHLSVTAFGPFADTVEVDFDALSGAGLFLLSGATGAGKSTVLDAVCFGLYGDVPGDRATAKRLRSDQAEPTARPQVVLEVTLSGRRFRITRSPAWVRPKRRGTGTTTEPAGVAVSERVDGDWVPLSTRLDESGHLVGRLVGMNMSQFVQVAMLPQGRFQAFLRARSEDRQRLLQQLFRTGRFAEVEHWLREHRISLRRRVDEAHQPIADTVSRVSEVTGASPPGWDLDDLTGPVLDGDLDRWLGGLREQGRRDRDAGTDTVRAAAAAEASAREQLERGRALRERLDRLAAARSEHAALLAAADDHREAVGRLEAARRAAPVTPLQRLLTDAERRAGRARAAVAALGDEEVPAEVLELRLAECIDARARVRALVPSAARLASIGAELERLTEQREEVRAGLDEVESRRAAGPARVEELREQVGAAAAASGALEAARLQLRESERRHRARAEALRVDAELQEARERLREACSVTLDRREEWLRIREARLEGMAAEIAGALAVGACCPVCGSAEHPQKAVAAADAPDADQERSALRSVDDAKATEHLRDVEVRDLETRLGALREVAGDADDRTLLAAVRDGEARVEQLVDRAAAHEPLARALAAAEASVRDDDVLASRLGVRAAELEHTSAALRAETERLTDEITSAIDGAAAEELDEVLDGHERAVTAIREALGASTERAAAERALDQARENLREAAAESGFDDPETAVASVLPAADLQRLEARTAQHRQRLAAVQEVLAASPEDDPVDDPPDLDALVERHADALDRLGAVRSHAEDAARRHQRLVDLAAALEGAIADWRPLRERLDVASRLCALVEGKSADNRWQMRLSAYVLAYRLSQVVAAANLRLGRMSDRRYSLEHTARRGAGETRGGLSLMVRDDWSGESRDPATLSGGETFVVSLALALGLADVITQEAGGADLDTLFVDEGFGSLDADTLDDVMDTLDSLRDGGRVVGVVSHVAEMRDRIPTQLVVTKDRRGSTVSVRGA